MPSSNTFKPVYNVTFIKQSHVLKYHIFLVLSQKCIFYELKPLLKVTCLIKLLFIVSMVTS